MARLDKKPYPGEWRRKEGESSKEHFERTNALYFAIPRERVFRTPVADGYAHYFIKKVSPLVLQHIPCDDAYEAHPALIRGLRTSDVLTWRFLSV